MPQTEFIPRLISKNSLESLWQLFLSPGLDQSLFLFLLLLLRARKVARESFSSSFAPLTRNGRDEANAQIGSPGFFLYTSLGSRHTCTTYMQVYFLLDYRPSFQVPSRTYSIEMHKDEEDAGFFLAGTPCTFQVF